MPMPAPEDRPLWAVGARRAHPPAPDRGQLLATLRRLGAESEALVALFDARSVAGDRHLLSAWAHLGRSRARGEERLRDRGAELALFLAGDDQLPRALKKVGFDGGTERFVLVGEKGREKAAVLDAFGLVEDPDAYPRPVGVELLERLEIPEAERRAVPESAWEGLVLERVAMMELTAPGRASPPKKA
jgi:tRNA threonylcarbamoyladenosine modification (KEOPS) complex Cgi121 subunit